MLWTDFGLLILRALLSAPSAALYCVDFGEMIVGDMEALFDINWIAYRFSRRTYALIAESLVFCVIVG